MTMISQYNPEYDAKPWLSNTAAKPLTASGGQLTSAQEPVFTTQAFPENSSGITAPGENGSGLPPIDYSLPKDFTGFGENGGGLPPIYRNPKPRIAFNFPPMQTMAYPENGGGNVITLAVNENGGGDLPIYRNPKPRIAYNFPPMQTMAYPENGGGIVTTLAFPENGGGSSVDPYAMVQNPWMSNSPQSPISENPFWGV